MLGTWLLSVPAISSEGCTDAAQAASKLAQEYRLAVGKVRTGCNRTADECNQLRAQADAKFDLLNAANSTMLAACLFGDPSVDDSLPVTAATVTAAIESLPEAVFIACGAFTFGPLSEVLFGCPGGTMMNAPRSELTVSSGLSANEFNYSMRVNGTGSIPVALVQGGLIVGTCDLSVSFNMTVAGSATFSSSVEFGVVNRLVLGVGTINTDEFLPSGCGFLDGSVLGAVVGTIASIVQGQVSSTLSRQFCGITGPELFGPCP